jgi:hypothetical protein
MGEPDCRVSADGDRPTESYVGSFSSGLLVSEWASYPVADW